MYRNPHFFLFNIHTVNVVSFALYTLKFFLLLIPRPLLKEVADTRNSNSSKLSATNAWWNADPYMVLAELNFFSLVLSAND